MAENIKENFKENNEPTPSLANASGKIMYGMTNDYMFKVVLESNLDILKALICALLHLNASSILNIEVKNPVTPGKSVEDKGFILDIVVLLNNNTILNLEMQLLNFGNWTDRALSYLCRSYDSLLAGQDYTEAMSAVHIGFLDFTLFKDSPEFYATYKMMNIKNHKIYSDKFTLSVVDLTKIDMATDEDKSYGIDAWASLFKATTWEELKAMGTQNAMFNDVAEAMLKFSSNSDVLNQCRKIDDHNRDIQRMRNENAKKDSIIADMSTQLAKQAAEIAALKDALGRT
jgi:predicted transposase/invertase (TIGR01784 family)